MHLKIFMAAFGFLVVFFLPLWSAEFTVSTLALKASVISA